MKPRIRIQAIGAACAAAMLLSFAPARAEQSTEELAKAAQNPVAKMISLPFQNNTTFSYGPGNDVQNVLNVQPVYPISLNDNWNLITRTILPIVYQPEVVPGDGSTFGLGDLNETVFFSPAKSGSLIWGVGPILTIPTATDDVLGTGKWLAGPSVVVLSMPGHWVLGALVNNQWSFAGDSDRESVNTFLLQYFVNYNFSKGWYVTSAPINTANWNEDSADRWTIPIGGGVGRIIKAGKQPMNISAQAYYNVRKPENLPSGDWQLRLQLQLLFPK